MADEKHFNPNEHITQLKTKDGPKDYLNVQWRLVWFREQCPQGTISTEIVHLDMDKEVTVMAYGKPKSANGIAVFKATVSDGNGASATGYGSECAADFGDYIEKAETKAIGRALAALGFGTQFAPELNEEHRIVDAPVQQQSTNKQTNAPRQAPVQQAKPEQKISGSMADEKQMQSIRALCDSLGRGCPTKLYKEAADKMQQDLEKEYQAQQRKAS